MTPRSLPPLLGLFAASMMALLMCVNGGAAEARPEFSTAGFFAAPDCGREVFNFNVGWRFHKGRVAGGEAVSFDDSAWPVVNAPDGLEILPADASGSINYQGEAWYRKHFQVPDSMRNRRIVLHFEAIMGKSRIWVNGKLLKEHFGGYLPIVIDVTDAVVAGGENVVAVLADNSDDTSYPPGTSQAWLDFSYFGGIYRDVWLYATAPVHITDSNQADTVAGGGVFVHYENLTDEKIDMVVSTQVANDTMERQILEMSSSVFDKDGKLVGEGKGPLVVEAGSKATITQTIRVPHPHLWTPDDPYLHRLVSKVGKSGKPVDGFATQTGIRTIEFRGKEGFFLNNRPFGDKLIGANRHQDFAYLGNALSNSLHWRDAQKLRNAGMRIIRASHYPEDPAFMDACDELGMFVIVATPGWHFWSDKPLFGERVYSDIRNMVRRDRNHPSVIMWEPVLNETDYPESFGATAHRTVHEEYPFQGCYTACDPSSAGSKYFDVLYGTDVSQNKSVFSREWGDHVDDWDAQNSPSRVRRAWGEIPQLVQAKIYNDPAPDYSHVSLQKLYAGPPQYVGGCIWHSFDTNRGYNPEPFYGGIADIFRQPKYAYYLFQSQRDPKLNVPYIENGPMVYIANELTPFSPADVRIFTNCEEVRLTVGGKVVGTKKAAASGASMPHPPVVFSNAYHFEDFKHLIYLGKRADVKMVAEGLIGGKVVTTAVKAPARLKHHIELSVDYAGIPLVADGSDAVVVVATLVDKDGNVRRLAAEDIVFEVVGEGRLIGSEANGANPRTLEWGTAPCLIQATAKPGKITVRARTLFEGVVTPASGEISLESVAPSIPLLFDEVGTGQTVADPSERKRNGPKKINLDEVAKQQTKFETR